MRTYENIKFHETWTKIRQKYDKIKYDVDDKTQTYFKCPLYIGTVI